MPEIKLVAKLKSMKTRNWVLAALTLVFISLSVWLFAPPDIATDAQLSRSPAALERGAYLVTAGGCISCHRGTQDTDSMSGGLELETEFGTFYAANITPDVETGIGTWQAREFLLALQHGRTPSLSFYYPTFPYRAYAGLSDQDVLDIGSYLMSLPPARNPVAEPEIPIWLARWTVAVWNRLADLSQPSQPSLGDELLDRGAYLARNLGHCGECHTPRNAIGIPDLNREFAGAELGDETVEPTDADALAQWTTNNFDLFLLLGMKPDSEFVGGDMNEVIEHNTSKLTDEDRDAIAAFFTRHNE
jgi:mono/diheme cytochrome c family protein